MTAAWGEAGAAGEGERLPGSRDLGDGVRIVFTQDPKVYRRLLHSRAVVYKITKRAEEIRDAANGMVALDPRTAERLGGDGQAAYKVEIENDPHDARARAKVMPASILGAVDDAHNATLLKSMDVHGGEA